MKLFVTRHGESETNSRRVSCGRSDVDLTETGVEQAKALAQTLVGKGIDLIIVSTLQRARRTAQIANEFIRVPVITDDRLVEMDFGAYEGVPLQTPAFLEIHNSFVRRYPNGESTCDVIRRVFDLMDEIKAEHSDKTVLLVTHGITARTINAYCLDLTDEQFRDFKIRNCELFEYQLD